jgi:hypothetical protein
MTSFGVHAVQNVIEFGPVTRAVLEAASLIAAPCNSNPKGNKGSASQIEWTKGDAGNHNYCNCISVDKEVHVP